MHAQMRAMANTADSHCAASSEFASKLKRMEQEVREQIAQVSAEHDAHDAKWHGLDAFEYAYMHGLSFGDSFQNHSLASSSTDATLPQ